MNRDVGVRALGVVNAVAGGVLAGYNAFIALRHVLLVFSPTIRLDESVSKLDFILNVIVTRALPSAMGILLLATGIGLLKQARWARPCAIVYGVLGLAVWALLALPIILGSGGYTPEGLALLKTLLPAGWAILNFVVGLRLRPTVDAAMRLGEEVSP